MKYIYKHGNQYWYQRAVPKQIIEILGKKTLKISLKTNKLITASKRAKLQALEHRKMFADIKKESKRYLNKILGRNNFDSNKYLIHFTEDYEDSLNKLLFNKQEFINLLINRGGEKNVNNNIDNSLLDENRLPYLSQVLFEYLKIKNLLYDNKKKISVKKSISHMVKICGDKQVINYSSLDAISFRDYFVKFKKISTGKRNQSNLQNLFSVIYNKYSIEKKNPFSQLEWPEFENKKNIQEFTDDELKKIKQFIQQKDVVENLICGLIFNTGCSFDEIFWLKTEDVNLNKYNPYIVIRSNSLRKIKNIYKRRVIPLVGISFDTMIKVKNTNQNEHLFKNFFNSKNNNLFSIKNNINDNIKKLSNGKTSISFKYSLIERLKKIGCPQEIIFEIVGLSKKESFYRSELNLDIKSSWLKQLK